MSAYGKVTPEIVEKFKEIAPGRVYVGEEINDDFTHDEMSIYGKAMPEAVVDAMTTEEVAAVVKICYENTIPVTARGAGTGLVGASVPIAGGVVIGTTKMNKILEYDLNNFVVKIQPGVLLNDLAEDCVSRGLMYPPDPGEKFAAVGGNVATNAGGMRACKYGATRDYVRAMTVVLSNGDIAHFGSLFHNLFQFIHVTSIKCYKQVSASFYTVDVLWIYSFTNIFFRFFNDCSFHEFQCLWIKIVFLE